MVVRFRQDLRIAAQTDHNAIRSLFWHPRRISAFTHAPAEDSAGIFLQDWMMPSQVQFRFVSPNRILTTRSERGSQRCLPFERSIATAAPFCYRSKTTPSLGIVTLGKCSLNACGSKV